MTGPTANKVEQTRATSGMIAVIFSDLAIAVAAILGVYALPSTSTSQNTTEIAAILTTAFATIGTMTTAYFGIKSMSNTALSLHDQGKSQEDSSKSESGDSGKSESGEPPPAVAP